MYYYDKTTDSYKKFEHAVGADIPTIICALNAKTPIDINAYNVGHGFSLSKYTGETEVYSALRLGYTKTTKNGYELYEKDNEEE